MIFKSDVVSSHWDTWIYFHQGTYHLYYLITESCGGDGFGVATSRDGVHWDDHGWALKASKDMVTYLGTGMVWPDNRSGEEGHFLCNYSEWRREGDKEAQNILFARSKDLVRWEKFGDEGMFRIDERYYEKFGGRWDCIYPLKKPNGNGYFGYWTATPKAFKGFGFGESRDGLRWAALPPPTIEWGETPALSNIEVGAIAWIKDQYYLMLGDYSVSGMFIMTGENPQGPFVPAAKNYRMFHNQSNMHMYFSRFFDGPDGLLLNHHVLLREKNQNGRVITYLAPLKAVMLEGDGTLYAKWWRGNDALKGSVLVSAQPTDLGTGIVMEGRMKLPGRILVPTGHGFMEIRVDKHGVVRTGVCDQKRTGFVCDETVDRGIAVDNTASFRLLVKGTLTEFYVDDYLMQCYTLKEQATASPELPDILESKMWKWA